MTSIDDASSSIRTSCRRALTSSSSIAGLRMSPASPPVQHTSTVFVPAALALAMVPAPFEASSSGWAWTVMTQRSGTSGMAATLPGPCWRSGPHGTSTRAASAGASMPSSQ
jgi:hypothetical protein